MNKIWLIGDTHFGHSNIIKYCNRPFSNVDEMDKILIANWNSLVAKNDEVIVVGDFALTNKSNIINIGNCLKGRKTLILGNHEQASPQTYYNAGFNFVTKYPIIIDNIAIISHYPIFNIIKEPYINIYAHVHNDKNYKDITENSFCVSAERIEYTPILYDDIIDSVKFYKERSKE